MNNILETIPPWLIITIVIVFIIGLLALFVSTFVKKPPYYRYVSDNIYKIKWKWFWKKENITELFCFCPTCDEALVYDDSSCTTASNNKETKFICEKCHFSSAINGGNISYSLDIVEREIHRKVRLNEFVVDH